MGTNATDVHGFADLPEQMVKARRWLLWKSEVNADPAKKPRKVPYYANGTRRSGTLDGLDDVAALATFEDALKALESGQYTGLGFALGPDGSGQCWQGIDLDDLPARPELKHLADNLTGYTEQSPSGRGVHAIGYGRAFQPLASNSTGIEAYAGGRFFTVTASCVGLHSPCDLAEFVEKELLPMHARGQAAGAPALGQLTVSAVEPQTVTDLRSALLYMRSDDRGLWVQLGHALKTLGDTGRGLWLEWSATSGKFDPADAAQTWESFRPKDTHHVAVFKEAQKRGWVNPRSLEAKASGSFGPVALSAGSITHHRPTIEFVPAGDLVRTPQPVEYLVDELIEHQSLMMLFGAPSAGKSFVAISMAACVATGHPWLGRDVRAGAVFYLAGEGHAGLSRRLRAWEIETGASLRDVPLFVSKVPAMLMDKAGADAVELAIKELSEKHGQPVLIVIDTLARNMGSGDENSNSDIGVFVAHIDGIRHRLGCTVQIVHHSGHMEGERARGASALPAAMDVIFQMEDKGGLRTLSQKKSKESELAGPISIKLKEVLLNDWLDGRGREMSSAVLVEADALEHAAVKTKKLTSRQHEGLQALCKAVAESSSAVEDGDWLGVTVESWRAEFYRTCSADDKKKAFQRVREDLKTRGLVRFENEVCFVRQSEPGLITHNLTTRMQSGGHGT